MKKKNRNQVRMLLRLKTCDGNETKKKRRWESTKKKIKQREPKKVGEKGEKTTHCNGRKTRSIAEGQENEAIERRCGRYATTLSRNIKKKKNRTSYAL